jgi:hypothetical protein
MAFPDDPLDIHVQAFLLGEWVDFGPIVTVTESYFRDYYTDYYTELYIGEHDVSTTVDIRRLPAQDIAITRGRSDEGSEQSPGSCSFILWNEDGYLTPGDPRSPWFATDGTGWGLNTQVRILVGTNVRFHGEVSEIVPEWPQGDIADELTDEELLDLGSVPVDRLGFAIVNVTVSGILRRLSQRTKPLRSALQRRVTSPTNLPHIVDYWPMEDGKDSGLFASGLPSSAGGLTKALHSGWTLASDDTLWGSQPLPNVGSGGDASWLATLNPARAAMTSGDAWVVEWNAHIPSPPVAAETSITMEITTDGSVWIATVGHDGDRTFVRLRCFNSTGLVLVDSYTYNPENLFIDQWVTFRVGSWFVGGNTHWVITWSPITPGVDAIEGGQSYIVGGTVGAPERLRFTVGSAPADGVSVGQVIVHDGILGGWLVNPDVGWQGERSGTRFRRIADEEGIPYVRVFGPAGSGLSDPTTTRKMGTQESRPVLDLLREAAATDNAILAERRIALGLQFIGRGARYNRPVRFELDARDKSQIANPFTPITDDQTRANDVTASKIDGTEYRVVDENAVEVYDQSLSFSTYSDFSVKHYAGWGYHLGTHEGSRYPQVTMDLVICGDTLTTGGLTLIDAWKTWDLQSRIRVVNLPAQHPDYPLVDLIIEGYTETLSAYVWLVELNCSPAAPWDVAVWGESRYTPESCVLDSGIDADDTSIVVDTSTAWDDGSTPFDVFIGPEISPERVTVTNVSGSTLTVTRGVAGYQRPHVAGQPVRAVVGVLGL